MYKYKNKIKVYYNTESIYLSSVHNGWVKTSDCHLDGDKNLEKDEQIFLIRNQF